MCALVTCIGTFIDSLRLQGEALHVAGPVAVEVHEHGGGIQQQLLAALLPTERRVNLGGGLQALT